MDKGNSTFSIFILQNLRIVILYTFINVFYYILLLIKKSAQNVHFLIRQLVNIEYISYLQVFDVNQLFFDLIPNIFYPDLVYDLKILLD